jgi:hypothetical protein
MLYSASKKLSCAYPDPRRCYPNLSKHSIRILSLNYVLVADLRQLRLNVLQILTEQMWFFHQNLVFKKRGSGYRIWIHIRETKSRKCDWVRNNIYLLSCPMYGALLVYSMLKQCTVHCTVCKLHTR